MKAVERIFGDEVSPELLFLCGLALFPAFLFQPLLSVRCLLAFLFLCLSIALGKAFHPVPAAVMSFGIVAFNAAVPFGRVIATVFGFKLTAGALFGGIEKAVTLEGLIWLSQVVVRPRIRFPGAVGALLAGSFGFFERITEERKSIDRKDIFGSLDRMLIRLWESGPAKAAPAGRVRTSFEGYVALALLIGACVLPYALILIKTLPRWLSWE
jgi:hypothetical protein